MNQVWTDIDPKDPYSCRALELNNKRFTDIFRYGEMGAAKRMIQASGKSAAELARQWAERKRPIAQNTK